MAKYTAVINGPPTADPTNGNIVISVTFGNGIRNVQRTIFASDLDQSLKNQCLRIAEQLEAQDAALAATQGNGQIVFR